MTSLAELLAVVEPIDLGALDARAALQKRVDTKYLVPAASGRVGARASA